MLQKQNFFFFSFFKELNQDEVANLGEWKTTQKNNLKSWLREHSKIMYVLKVDGRVL